MINVILAVWFGVSLGLFKYSWDGLNELQPNVAEYDGWHDEERGY